MVKYPVKGFGTPHDALAYIKTLRPNAAGRVASKRQGEPTVRELYEYVRAHSWKKLSERRKAGKESRWKLHIAPYWAEWALSEVSRRAAQEWLTGVEEKIANGQAGSLGIPQLNEVRTDLSQLFEVAPDFDDAYEERRNPFQGLSFEVAPQRAKVTLESASFDPILNATFTLVKANLAVDWVAQMFATSLLAGLREGEVMALMANRIDWNRKIITVDRALRLNAQDVDDETGLPSGEIKRMALGLPKNDKTRIVPMSNQLITILEPLCEKIDTKAPRPFLWQNGSGGMKELTRLQLGFTTLRKNLGLMAKFEHGRWSKLNDLIDELKERKDQHLPKVFDRLDFRDTRNSFASYANEVGMPQATREAILGHSKGITNVVYTELTATALKDAQKRLSRGWVWKH